MRYFLFSLFILSQLAFADDVSRYIDASDKNIKDSFDYESLIKDLGELTEFKIGEKKFYHKSCLLYTSPSPRDATLSRMPSSA